MKNSELGKYLRDHASEGTANSKGEFTIAKAEAFRKIIEFQLPFEHAWAVKLIQAIVAGGTTKPITVELHPLSIKLSFFQPGFKLKELELAFFNPQPSSNRSLRYLLSGLWVIGIRNQCKFEIALLDEKDVLTWNGKALGWVEPKTKEEQAYILITSPDPKSLDGLLHETRPPALRSQPILKVLTDNCYPCPVPLYVYNNKRRVFVNPRIDALQWAKHQGWSTYTYPVSVSGLDAELPSLKIPMGTYEKKVGGRRRFEYSNDDGGGWRNIAIDNMSKLAPITEAAIPYILSIHVEGYRTKDNNDWREGKGFSTAYWVLDGAIVGEERLLNTPSYCSVGCFLNAEGLLTDLTTLQVISTPEKERRLNIARKALGEGLPELTNIRITKSWWKGHEPKRISGIAIALLLPLATPDLWELPGFLALHLLTTTTQLGQRQIDAAKASLQHIKKMLSGQSGSSNNCVN